ncbi:hypothetical protein [Arcticibacterium luteifluviistationis]|uniref:DUF1761 domain-containing protein n=1 Tax=Arcticibacterium luteifluviistationis TaxID=1784714 RepID=A0A2Z4G974_9BACT|nr:hypothetical protein [Arcticibacterium luteifluviistationis]AWV97789.1 hypothetical protein DJ013_06240 [Arcticibacterium luteifluviistationis]
MKKILIAAAVGGLILLIWQTLSWTVLNIHGDMQTYSPNQDTILEFLGENLEEGFYYLPTVAPGESVGSMEDYMGKPWAQVFYHEAYDANMGANMFRGFIVNILAAALLAWMLLKMGNASFQTILFSSIAVGIIGYLTTNYATAIWFQTHTIPDLIDAVVSWTLVGLWFGWWLRK